MEITIKGFDSPCNVLAFFREKPFSLEEVAPVLNIVGVSYLSFRRGKLHVRHDTVWALPELAAPVLLVIAGLDVEINVEDEEDAPMNKLLTELELMIASKPEGLERAPVARGTLPAYSLL